MRLTRAIPSERAGVVALLYIAGAVATANADQIYWAQTVGNQIKRADLDGANVETLVERPWVDDPVAIALDPMGGKIYWAQTIGNQIKRFDLTVESVETLVQCPGWMLR